MTEVKESFNSRLFLIVLILFLISVGVIVVGIFRGGKVENSLSEESFETVIGPEDQDSLSNYFEEKRVPLDIDDEEGAYVLTDPFYEKCKSEGSSFGTKCYY